MNGRREAGGVDVGDLSLFGQHGYLVIASVLDTAEMGVRSIPEPPYNLLLMALRVLRLNERR